jgi:hypothetical protein
LIATSAILLTCSAVVWVLPGLIDSLEQRTLHRAPVHPDQSTVRTHVIPALTTPKTLIYRDRNGTLYRLLADETEVDRFANDTLIYLDSERSKIKADTQRQIDELLENAFSDGEASIARYVDWYFQRGTVLVNPRRGDGRSPEGLGRRQRSRIFGSSPQRGTSVFDPELRAVCAQARIAQSDH